MDIYKYNVIILKKKQKKNTKNMDHRGWSNPFPG